MTNVRGLCLGVYVADCCAIYLADPVKRAIGLLHSGKKGTELGIAPESGGDDGAASMGASRGISWRN